jgi:hypothetical protein
MRSAETLEPLYATYTLQSLLIFANGRKVLGAYLPESVRALSTTMVTHEAQYHFWPPLIERKAEILTASTSWSSAIKPAVQ